MKDKLRPKPSQKEFYSAIHYNRFIIVTGPPGSGKTIIPLIYATENEIPIVFVRPTLTCGEKLGSLPGTVSEKISPFTQAARDTLKKLGSNIKITFHPIGYIKGATFDNCLMILDEAQDTTPDQLKLFLTRVGHDAKIIISGDLKQSELKGVNNGLKDAITRFEGLARYVEMTEIHRDEFLKKIYERYNES